MRDKCPAHLITPDLITIKVSGAQYKSWSSSLRNVLHIRFAFSPESQELQMCQLAIHNVIITTITLMFRDKSISLLIP
jgi:hypothetical protein